MVEGCQDEATRRFQLDLQKRSDSCFNSHTLVWGLAAAYRRWLLLELSKWLATDAARTSAALDVYRLGCRQSKQPRKHGWHDASSDVTSTDALTDATGNLKSANGHAAHAAVATDASVAIASLINASLAITLGSTDAGPGSADASLTHASSSHAEFLAPSLSPPGHARLLFSATAQ